MSGTNPSTPRLPALLPAPRRVHPDSEGYLPLRDGLPIVLPLGSNDADFQTALALQSKARERAGLHWAVETHRTTAGLGPRIELLRTAEQGESYRLRVEQDRVEVVGEGAAGLRYAVETLSQLVEHGGKRGRIPTCTMEDEPDFRRRGLLMDVSRGKVPTRKTLEALVDVCVSLKLNVLMLYTEHVFRFRRHPAIGADASPLDAATIRGLDAYAAARHVELVPTLQSLGHMHHILELAPYGSLAETPKLWTISPVAEGTYPLLRDLYDEYLPNFRSALFNANCDEPVDLGEGLSRERCEQEGKARVYLEHVRKVRDLARAHGKQTLIWADVVHQHPEHIAEIDHDLVLLDWWYEASHDYDRVRVFSENGIAFWVCPGTSSWNSLFPRVENALANIAGYASAGRRHGAVGLLTTDWGDGGHYNLLGNSWLGLAWGAQQAWSGNVTASEFDQAFSRQLFGDPTGRIARAYRELGGLHDTGFALVNGSPLKSLYFDDLDAATYIARARVKSLRATHRRLLKARERTAALRPHFRRELVTHDELLLAADESLLAVEKGLAGLTYLVWRRNPNRWRASDRRRLARSLRELAERQTDLLRRLRRLWLVRNRPSNFEIARDKVKRSIGSLRKSARALEKNSPPP